MQPCRIDVAHGLERSGQIVFDRGRKRPARVLSLAVGRDHASTRALRRFWAEQALSRLDADSDDMFAYNVFGVSEAHHRTLRTLRAESHQRMRELIARSEPDERVPLARFEPVALDRIPK